MVQCSAKALLAVVLTGLACFTENSVAAESPSGDPGLVQRIEEQAKQAGKSVEETFKNTVKKVEEERIPEKVEKKTKEIVNDVVEGFEKTGKNLEKKSKE